MSSQNILKYYGTRLDLKLDSSELYDYEIGKNEIDFNTEVLDLETEITYSALVIDSNCLDVTVNSIKPWEIEIDTPYTHDDTCDFTVKKRTEKGWTLDFVFNREDSPWISGSTFYYWGIKNESNSENYLDNNLSFSFTSDGRIKWEAYRYSGYCHITSGYSETSYISSGQTPVMCTGGTSDDFNITITFDRYKYYTTECDLENMGGINDLVSDITINNTLEFISGGTADYTTTQSLNKKWSNEKDRRLGVLKIYLNGRPIYKIENWEEIVPSVRSSENPIVQIWGGGTLGSGGIHGGTTGFNLKKVRYYEEPLGFVYIRHLYLTTIKPNYSVNECVLECEDDITFYDIVVLQTENEFVITTEDEYILIY